MLHHFKSAKHFQNEILSFEICTVAFFIETEIIIIVDCVLSLEINKKNLMICHGALAPWICSLML